MKRFFRWGYIVPRLILLLLLLGLSEYGVAWLVKHSLRAGGESAVGARVDIGQVKASLLKTSVELRNLQVANPESPMTNLVEADALLLDFDSDSLLRKQAVVTHGAVRGLRFGASRVASGELDEPLGEPEDESMPAWLSEAASDKAKAWLSDLGERFTSDLEDQFQSVRVAQQMRDKWPGKYEELAAAAGLVKSEAKTLKEQVAQARKNPLRNAQFLQSVPQRVVALENQLKQLTSQLKALPSLIEADRQAVKAARTHDEKLVRETLRVEAIDSASLTAYLLGEEISGPMGELIGWLRWARKMAPTKVEKPDAERHRGVDVLFAGLRPRPELLIRQLDLSGTARINGRPVELAGTLSDFTTEPEIHGQPVRLNLTTTGAMPIKLKATIDRTGPSARDELLADCQGIVIPKLRLGGGKWFGLSVEKSRASLSVSLLLDGEKLSGDVQLIQQQVRVTPDVQQKRASAAATVLHEALAAKLNRLPSIATRIDLSGTLDKPQWQVWSNLGPAVAQAVESAVEQTVEGQTERLLAASQAEVDAQLAKLDGELADAAARLQPLLDGPAGTLKQVVSELSGGSSFQQLGSRLKGAGSLFK